MNLKGYEDVLSFQKSKLCQFAWSQKKIDVVVANKQDVPPTPNSHKKAVLNDPKIKELISKLSIEKGISKEYLEVQSRLILDEIGYNKNIRVIRWLALILVEICLKLCQGIYVNTNSILHTKSMGDCPVVFVPSHRSYADFILMSFLCFNYDVAIPAIAAGMDFHGMIGMGAMLRDTGAFFMRRSYNSDVLYWTIFKQYIYQLVTKGELAIEFFIEGTRSRSNKSLMPKYGLLNMILKPLFLNQVPNIIFVPISISYERILEEKLFAFELLGVPKPKESTSGFFKSLKVLKENFGSIHVTFGDGISSNELFGEHLKSKRRCLGPIHAQDLDESDKKVIPNLAFKIIQKQEEMTVLNLFNLTAMILNCHKNCGGSTSHGCGSTSQVNLIELKVEIDNLMLVLNRFGAKISTENSIETSLKTHKDFVILHDGKVDLICTRITKNCVGNEHKLKAFNLSEEIMTNSVPFIQLFLYINPIMFFIIDSALILTIIQSNVGNFESTESEILNQFEYLRLVFINEFVTIPWDIPKAGRRALQLSTSLNLIHKNGAKYSSNPSNSVVKLLITTLQPFIMSYCNVMEVLMYFNEVEEKTILVESQKRIVHKMNAKNEFIHPYCLNLDSMTHCLNSLTNLGILAKKSRNIYNVMDAEKLELVKVKLDRLKMCTNPRNLINKL